MKNHTLSNLLRAARHTQNLTQRELATQLGYHPQFISNWERGCCLPPYAGWSKICRILKLDSEKVFEILMQIERRKWQIAMRDV